MCLISVTLLNLEEDEGLLVVKLIVALNSICLQSKLIITTLQISIAQMEWVTVRQLVQVIKKKENHEGVLAYGNDLIAAIYDILTA